MKFPGKNKLAFNLAVQIIAAVLIISSGFYVFANIQAASIKKRIYDKASLFSAILGANLDKIVGDNLKSCRELQEATELIAKTSANIEEVAVIAPNHIVIASSKNEGIWTSSGEDYASVIQGVIDTLQPRSVTKVTLGKELVVHFDPIFKDESSDKNLIGILRLAYRFPSQQSQVGPALRANKRTSFKIEASSYSKKLSRDMQKFIRDSERNLGYLGHLIDKMKSDVDIFDIKLYLDELGVLVTSHGDVKTQFVANVKSPLHEQVMQKRGTIVSASQIKRDLVEVSSPLYLEDLNTQKVGGAVSIIFSLSKTYAQIARVRNNILFMAVIIIGAFCLLIILFFKRKILTPVNDLIDITEAIKKSDFSKRCRIHNDDEIGKLAEEFNNMITELERSKKEIENFNVQLQDKVVEVSDELKEKQSQLLESEKMASLGALSSGIAHEINNPLGVILGHTQMLLREFKEKGELENPKEAEGLLESIEQYTKRCSHIVKSLLQFTRKRELQFIETDVEAAIDNSVLFVSGKLSSKEINVVKKLSKKIPRALADSIQLEQVFINILLNAEQSMEKSGKIEITAKPDGDMVIITFEDNGPGISEEHLSKIFDPFFSTKEPGQGVGLGLSVSYGIIKAHNGKIEIKSEDQKGTIVEIRLPIFK